MNQYDYILEVEPVEKFNPYHDERGRFASRGRYSFFTIRTKDPGKQHWADMAVAREKDKEADRNARLRAQRKEKEAQERKRKEQEQNQQAKVEFTPAKSKKEAVSYAKENLGFKNVSFGTKMDLDTINHINRNITEIQAKYPEVKGAVSTLKTTAQKGVYAFVKTHGSGEMELNVSTKVYSKGVDAVEKLYKHGVDSGFAPAGTKADSVIWHEYGHILGAISTKQKHGLGPSETISRNDYNAMVDFMTDKKGGVMETEWITKAAQSLGMGDWSGQQQMKASISKYATYNNKEAFAEAFAEVSTSKNPRKEALAIVKASGWYRE